MLILDNCWAMWEHCGKKKTQKMTALLKNTNKMKTTSHDTCTVISADYKVFAYHSTSQSRSILCPHFFMKLFGSLKRKEHQNCMVIRISTFNIQRVTLNWPRVWGAMLHNIAQTAHSWQKTENNELSFLSVFISSGNKFHEFHDISTARHIITIFHFISLFGIVVYFISYQ